MGYATKYPKIQMSTKERFRKLSGVTVQRKVTGTVEEPVIAVTAALREKSSEIIIAILSFKHPWTVAFALYILRNSVRPDFKEAEKSLLEHIQDHPSRRSIAIHSQVITETKVTDKYIASEINEVSWSQQHEEQTNIVALLKLIQRSGIINFSAEVIMKESGINLTFTDKQAILNAK